MNRLRTGKHWLRVLMTVTLLLVAVLAPPRGESTPSGINLPFPENEKLIFEIKLNRFPLYVTLGHITFEYKGVSDNRKIEGAGLEMSLEGDAELLRLKALAVSKGFLGYCKASPAHPLR